MQRIGDMTPQSFPLQQLQSFINASHTRTSPTRQYNAGYYLALHINIASFIVGLSLLTYTYQE
ncbi:hypothetical protein TUM17559_52760 [Enterobacter cloacae]|nr:SusC/RagA family TonB-linked outer membrane protein [Klebsiella oxytoca]GJK47133.1 hypothetical protein TUM17559_52760 [Enterobacter cloacae]GJL15631.1 hypothetical protein TUM17572_54380 [Klebsiella oxytoca]